MISPPAVPSSSIHCPGFVFGSRVMGELAVSRAFGDAEFKKESQISVDEEGGGGDGKCMNRKGGYPCGVSFYFVIAHRC